MPESNSPQQNTGNAFEIVTPSKSKKVNMKSIIIIAAVFLFLGIAVFLGVYLVQQQQNIQEKAAVTTCPAAEQCPNSKNPNLLQSCHPGESDGSTSDRLCNTAGRVETCGPATTKYCCPAPGAAWTTDMSVCNSLSATATPTATPTPTATATATPTIEPLVTQAPTTGSPTPTSTVQAASTASPVPIPVTGVEWPTVLGIGVGAVTIIGSILLAL